MSENQLTSEEVLYSLPYKTRFSLFRIQFSLGTNETWPRENKAENHGGEVKTVFMTETKDKTKQDKTRRKERVRGTEHGRLLCLRFWTSYTLSLFFVRSFT